MLLRILFDFHPFGEINLLTASKNDNEKRFHPVYDSGYFDFFICSFERLTYYS